MARESVRDLWARYEAWLAAHASLARDALRPPAESGELGRLEGALGQALPEGLRQLYLVHDGQAWDFPWVFPDGQWLPVTDVLGTLQEMRSDPRWERDWCPLVSLCGAGLVAVRCGGSRALVYDFSFEDGGMLAADGLEAWLAEQLRRIESGEVRFGSESGFVPGK